MSTKIAWESPSDEPVMSAVPASQAEAFRKFSLPGPESFRVVGSDNV